MKLIKYLTPLLFITVLFLPILSPLFGVDKKINAELGENRKLAPMPNWDGYFNMKSYIQKLELYINDHFGLRNSMVLLNSYIRVNLFKETSSDRSVIGENGWWFLLEKNNHAVKQVCTAESIAHSRNDIGIQLKRTIKQFDDAGINIVYAIIPRKMQIYYYELPAQFQAVCNEGVDVVSSLISDLDPTTASSILYPKAEFIELSKKHNLYGRYRFHWYPGSYSALHTADLILDSYQVPFSRVIERSTGDLQSDLGHLVLGKNGVEKTEFYFDKNRRLDGCQPLHCYPEFSKHHPTGGYSSYWQSDNLNTDNKLLIISDSFGPQIAPYFTSVFDSVLQVSMNGLDVGSAETFQNWIVSDYKPSHVVILIQSGNAINLGDIYTPDISTREKQTISDLTSIRIDDLAKIRNAIIKYRDDHGFYPATKDGEWASIATLNKSRHKEWIPGLYPDYLNSIPIDPSGNTKWGESMYLYKSDGVGFKLIASKTGDCAAVNGNQVFGIDPKRSSLNKCWAWGVWSEDFKNL